jgi:hypothetical protein
MRQLQRDGLLPRRQDRNGIYRFHPHEVAEVARKLRRSLQTDAETAARIYGSFLAPGFRGTPKGCVGCDQQCSSRIPPALSGPSGAG